ncbi:MAG TPA: hypothetical protein VIL36_08155 [Acidimicrobiales bacterium]
MAERLDDLVDLGADALILSGLPHLEEALRVGEEVLPLFGGAARKAATAGAAAAGADAAASPSSSSSSAESAAPTADSASPTESAESASPTESAESAADLVPAGADR